MSMSSVIDINTNIDSPIPTGSWTLYFHSPEETKWTLNTFISLGSMKKWEDFWGITIINHGRLKIAK